MANSSLKYVPPSKDPPKIKDNVRDREIHTRERDRERGEETAKEKLEGEKG